MSLQGDQTAPPLNLAPVAGISGGWANGNSGDDELFKPPLERDLTNLFSLLDFMRNHPRASALLGVRARNLSDKLYIHLCERGYEEQAGSFLEQARSRKDRALLGVREPDISKITAHWFLGNRQWAELQADVASAYYQEAC